MSSIESVKENVYSIILKSGGRASIDKILKWAEENQVGRLALALAIRELEQEKKIRTSGEYQVLFQWRARDGVFKLVLPRVIESTTVTAKTAKTTTRTTTKKTSLSELLGLETPKETKKSAATTTTKSKTEEAVAKEEAKPVEIEVKLEVKPAEAKPQEETSSRKKTAQATETIEVVAKPEVREVEVPVKPVVKPAEKTETTPRVELTAANIVQEVIKLASEELREVDTSKLEQVVNATLQYLGRYWSVGEIRARLDISKMLSQKLKLDQEVLFELVGKVLRILRRLGVVEIVEPGVVNLLRRDLVPQTKTKFSEVLGL